MATIQKTIGDVVREHANKQPSSTVEAMDLLEISHDADHRGAGNLYIAALTIINKQAERIAALEAENKQLRAVLKQAPRPVDLEQGIDATENFLNKYFDWDTRRAAALAAGK